MFRHQELNDASSCLNRAKDREMVFTLLARDVCAPSTLLFWVAQRLATGKNKPEDPQILGALECAAIMRLQLSQKNGNITAVEANALVEGPTEPSVPVDQVPLDVLQGDHEFIQFLSKHFAYVSEPKFGKVEMTFDLTRSVTDKTGAGLKFRNLLYEMQKKAEVYKNIP